MRIAVVSDIHSNMDGLSAVLADIETRQVDRIISLGDNIGYGPQPQAVMDLLEKKRIPSVMGNHEQALVTPALALGFSPGARMALEINRARISHRTLENIRAFKPFLQANGACFVHGLPPDRVSVYVSKLPLERLALIMAGLKQQLSFVGHTHRLAVYELGPQGIICKKFWEKRVFLAKDSIYIINSGSAGQPRGSHNEATYVIWDSQAGYVESRAVPYDASRTVRMMERAGIPKGYADMIRGKAGTHNNPKNE